MPILSDQFIKWLTKTKTTYYLVNAKRQVRNSDIGAGFGR